MNREWDPILPMRNGNAPIDGPLSSLDRAVGLVLISD